MTLSVRYQLLLLAFVVLGIYYPVIFAPFCSTDDYRLVAALLNQDSFDIYRLFFPHGGGGQYYRPLLYLTFISDKFVWGLEESFMHLENLVLHLGNALLVFASVRMLFKSWKVEQSAWAPLVAALIFALHPINTEAVDWISGRTDLLACFFVLLSLLFLSASLNGRPAAALCSGCALLLGALSKETALFFTPAALFLVLCYDARFGRGRSWQERCKEALLPVLAIVCAASVYLIMRASALSVNDKGVTQVVQLATAPPADLLNLLRVVAKLTGFYLKKLFMPLPLSFGILEVSHYYVVPGALFLALLCYLLYKRNLASFLIIAAFCTCVPCFLLAVSKISWTPVAERYLYIPSAMFAMVLVLWGMALGRLAHGKLTLVAICSVVLGGSAYATTSRNIVWQDNFTLFEDTSRKSPEFLTAKNDMAVALMQKGNTAEAYRILKTLSVQDSHLASLNLAHVHMAEGKLPEAREILYDRLKEDRGYRGDLLELLVKIAELRRAKSVEPKERQLLNEELKQLISQQYRATENPFFQYRLGLVHLQLNDRRAAFSSFSSARSGAPAGSHYRQAAIQLTDKYRP